MPPQVYIDQLYNIMPGIDAGLRNGDTDGGRLNR